MTAACARARRARKLAWLCTAALCLGLCACRGQTTEAKVSSGAHTSPETRAVTASQPAPQAAPTAGAPELAFAKVAQRSGTVWAYQPGRVLDEAVLYARGAPFGTGTDGHLSLDFDNGARVTLEPGSTALLAPYEAAALIVVEGAVHVQLPPQGNAARATLRIASAELTLSAPRAVELWLRASLGSGTYVALLSGEAELQTWALDAEAPQSSALVAGRACTVRAAVASCAAGPTTLAQAQAGAAPAKVAVAKAAELLLVLQALGSSYARAASRIDELRSAAVSVRAQQRAAHARADSSAVAALQRTLVQEAQELVQTRSRLAHAYERRLSLLYALQAMHAELPEDVHDLAAAYGATLDVAAGH
ncbi:MAG TPA: hypothetical protein VF331_26540 [Polyangiales bacterium]